MCTYFSSSSSFFRLAIKQMVQFRLNTVTGCMEYLVMKHRVPVTGLVGTAQPPNNFALAVCSTMKMPTAVIGPKMSMVVRSIVSIVIEPHPLPSQLGLLSLYHQISDYLRLHCSDFVFGERIVITYICLVIDWVPTGTTGLYSRLKQAEIYFCSIIDRTSICKSVYPTEIIKWDRWENLNRANQLTHPFSFIISVEETNLRMLSLWFKYDRNKRFAFEMPKFVLTNDETIDFCIPNWEYLPIYVWRHQKGLCE